MRIKVARRSTRGISVVEFVGCLAALGGGIVLGSIYLGVDVKAMAAGILEKADISVPAVLTEDEQAEVKSSTDQASPEDANAPTTGEPISDSSDSTDGESDLSLTDSDAAEHVAVSQEPTQLSDEEQRIATKQCWTALNAAMKSESSNRSKSIRDPGNWQLFDYLLHRKEGHEKVVEAIEEIDLNGVDSRLNAHVQQVLAWHRAGTELFERATHLLTDAPAGRLSGPFAQSWQSASTQHRMEEKLILNKHSAVASYLEHTQKPSAASSTTE